MAGLPAAVLTPPFIVAFVILVSAAVVVGPIGRWMHVKQAKLPLPLRAPLGALDEGALAPYRVVNRIVLEPSVVEALGTDQYISWAVEDTTVDRADPLRFATLLVTYDTGGRNLVPHRPDVCYLGAGYEPAQAHENIEIEVPSLGAGSARVPVRVCTFVQTSLKQRAKTTVIYTFHCNGRFVSTRTGVRLLLNDLTTTYAYFSKVEVSFPKATREQSVEGAKKLLNRVLPVLVSAHWPDFDAEEEAVRRQANRAE